MNDEEIAILDDLEETLKALPNITTKTINTDDWMAPDTSTGSPHPKIHFASRPKEEKVFSEGNDVYFQCSNLFNNYRRLVNEMSSLLEEAKSTPIGANFISANPEYSIHVDIDPSKLLFLRDFPIFDNKFQQILWNMETSEIVIGFKKLQIMTSRIYSMAPCSENCYNHVTSLAKKSKEII